MRSATTNGDTIVLLLGDVDVTDFAFSMQQLGKTISSTFAILQVSNALRELQRVVDEFNGLIPQLQPKRSWLPAPRRIRNRIFPVAFDKLAIRRRMMCPRSGRCSRTRGGRS